MNSPFVDLWESLSPSDAELEEMDGGVELSVELAPDLSDGEASDVDGDEDGGGPTGTQVEQSLLDAAHAAASVGVDLDEFMRTAWKAFLKANPDVHKQLEHNALLKHLEMLRRIGKMGQA